MNDNVTPPTVEDLAQAKAIGEQANQVSDTRGRELIGEVVNASLAKYLVDALKSGSRDNLVISVYLDTVPSWDTGMTITLGDEEDLAVIRNTANNLGGMESYVDTVDDLYKPYVAGVGVNANQTYLSVIIVLA